MEREKVRLDTYRAVWSQERVIYQIERVRLPFPVTFRQMGVFTASLVLMVLLSRIPGMATLSPVLRYVLVPGILTWFLTQQQLDGKPPLQWAFAMFLYLVRPKRLNRFQPMDDPADRLWLRRSIRYRTKG